MNAAQHQADAPPQPPAGVDSSKLLHYLMYALQGYDAVNSAKLFKHPGTFETDPAMKPFSHGGAPTMLGGFAIEDLLRGVLQKHASPGAQNSGDAAQILANILGILQTNRAQRATKP